MSAIPAKKSTPAGRPPGEKVCPSCGGTFHCGTAAGEPDCWCARLPPQPIDPAVTGCLCPDCLQARADRA